MTLTNLKITDLITPDAKLTFLVGAGCSVDAPSCLPAGRPMMEAIIKYTCVESEVDKLLNINGLRFEHLIEIVRDTLDEELKVIDFYGLCEKPNLQHFFLADSIKRGHFVLTTNFDFLIEHALIQSGVNEDDIICVITKDDFQNYSNPEALKKEGKKVLYKIHGSTKNSITKKSTKPTLITTLKAFGSNKKGLNIFAVEPFKRELFNNITKDRSLVIMGYSGSDDFDVVPTLKLLEDLQDVIWINHINNDEGNEKIYEIDANMDGGSESSDNTNQILVGIKRMNNANRVFRINVNTSRMVKILLNNKHRLSSEDFSMNPIEWLKENIRAPDEIIKYYIPFRIYFDLNLFDDSLKLIKKILTIAENLEKQSWIVNALTFIGEINKNKGNYSEALDMYNKASNIHESSGFKPSKSLYLSRVTLVNNIGTMYLRLGKYKEALECYQMGLEAIDNLEDMETKATIISNIGVVYYNKGEFSRALAQYEEALKIDEQLGNLWGMADRLYNIGSIHLNQSNFPKAVEYFGEVLKIDEQMGNLSGRATTLIHFGNIYKAQGNFLKAMNYFDEALKLNEKLGDKSVKSIILNNIGEVYKDRKNYHEALKFFDKALRIMEELEETPKMANTLFNIGNTYFEYGMYDQALKFIIESLEINKDLKNRNRMMSDFYTLALIYFAQGDIPLTLDYFSESLKVARELNDLTMMTRIYLDSGKIYFNQWNYPFALRRFEEALKISEEQNNTEVTVESLNNIAAVYIRQHRLIDARKLLEKALEILNMHALSDSDDAKMIKETLDYVKSQIDDNAKS